MSDTFPFCFYWNSFKFPYIIYNNMYREFTGSTMKLTIGCRYSSTGSPNNVAEEARLIFTLINCPTL